ncbi:MAG: PH domain-containing protein [Candidatus Heimdallarchaeota archaeon]|nr:PH domain-containing protein [Candidatus Heimdallarchaeota archaeon]
MTIVTNQPFKPITALRSKYILLWIISFLLINLPMDIFMWIIDSNLGFWYSFYSFIVTAPIHLIGIYGSIKYYNSVDFKIAEESIQVNRGIITRSNKIVPFRTITNIDIRQGPFDRLFGIGSVELQTAGSSGPAMPEGKIDGIPYEQVTELREFLIEKVRKIKGSAAISHDNDYDHDEDYENNDMKALLKEVRELKDLLFEKLK